MPKGISLPIDTMVIFVIAVVVLAAVMMIIFGGIQPSTRGVMLQNAVQQCCHNYLNTDCKQKTVACSVAKELGYPGDVTLDTLATDAGITNLDKFCKCP